MVLLDGDRPPVGLQEGELPGGGGEEGGRVVVVERVEGVGDLREERVRRSSSPQVLENFPPTQLYTCT